MLTHITKVETTILSVTGVLVCLQETTPVTTDRRARTRDNVLSSSVLLVDSSDCMSSFTNYVLSFQLPAAAQATNPQHLRRKYPSSLELDVAACYMEEETLLNMNLIIFNASLD